MTAGTNADDRLRVYIGPRRKRRRGGYYPRWPFRFRLPGEPWVYGTGGFTEASTRQLVDGMIRDRMTRRHLADLAGRGLTDATREPVDRHLAEYLEWGRHEGGRGGLPWSADHLAHRRAQLGEWMRVLAPASLADLTYDAFAAENTRRLARGLAPNTVNHHAWALVAFTSWCHQRGRLASNPLAHFTSLDRRPQRERGAFGAGEFRALLTAAPPTWALVYRTAIFTGLRRSALASLKVRDVDWSSGLVTLPWGASKNRRTVVKPLPAALLADLRAACAVRRGDDPLLDFSPRQAARAVHRDMRAAGLAIEKDGRRRDFHSLKASLGTLLDDLGAMPEVTQKALDHASFRQTQVYIKRETAPLRAAVEELERRLAAGDAFPARVTEPPETAREHDDDAGAAGSTHSVPGAFPSFSSGLPSSLFFPRRFPVHPDAGRAVEHRAA